MTLKSWDKVIDGEYYYVRLDNAKLIFGNIFEGGKSGLERVCSFNEFLHEDHEMLLRITEIFGPELIHDIKEEILAFFESLSKELE